MSAVNTATPATPPVSSAFQVLPCIPGDDCQAYQAAWSELSSGSDHLRGHVVAPWLVSLGFDRTTLRAAWAAVDVDNTGTVDEAQFVVLMRLLQLQRAGIVSETHMNMSAVLSHARLTSHNPLSQDSNGEMSAAHIAHAPVNSSGSAAQLPKHEATQNVESGDDDFGDFGDFAAPEDSSPKREPDNPFDSFSAESSPTHPTAPAVGKHTPAPLSVSDAFAGLLGPAAAPPAPFLAPPSQASLPMVTASSTPTAQNAERGLTTQTSAAAQTPTIPAGDEDDDFEEFGDFGQLPTSSAELPPHHLPSSAPHQQVQEAPDLPGPAPTVPPLDMPAPLPRGEDDLTIVTSISTVSSEIDSLARDIAYIEHVAHGRSDQLRGTAGEACHPSHLVEYVQRLCKRADEVATRCLLRLDGIHRTPDTRLLRKSEVRRVNQLAVPLRDLPYIASARAEALPLQAGLSAVQGVPRQVEPAAVDAAMATGSSCRLPTPPLHRSTEVSGQGGPLHEPEAPAAVGLAAPTPALEPAAVGDDDDFEDFGAFDQAGHDGTAHAEDGGGAYGTQDNNEPPQPAMQQPPSAVQVAPLAEPAAGHGAACSAPSQPEPLLSRQAVVDSLVKQGRFVRAWGADTDDTVFQAEARRLKAGCTSDGSDDIAANDTLQLFAFVRNKLPASVWLRAIHVVETHALYAGLDAAALTPNTTPEQLLERLQGTAREDTWQGCLACRRLARLAALALLLHPPQGAEAPPAPPSLLHGLKVGAASDQLQAMLLFPLVVAAELRLAAAQLRGGTGGGTLSAAAVSSWALWLDGAVSLSTLASLAVLTIVEAGFQPVGKAEVGSVWALAGSVWESLRSAAAAAAPALLNVFQRGTAAGCPVPESASQGAMWLLGVPDLQDLVAWSDSPPAPPSTPQGLTTAEAGTTSGDWCFSTAAVDNATLQTFHSSHLGSLQLQSHCSQGGECALHIDALLLASSLESAPALGARWGRGAEFGVCHLSPDIARFPASSSVWRRLAGHLSALAAASMEGGAGGVGPLPVAAPEPALVCSTGMQAQVVRDVWMAALAEAAPAGANADCPLSALQKLVAACTNRLLHHK